MRRVKKKEKTGKVADGMSKGGCDESGETETRNHRGGGSKKNSLNESH